MAFDEIENYKESELLCEIEKSVVIKRSQRYNDNRDVGKIVLNNKQITEK